MMRWLLALALLLAAPSAEARSSAYQSYNVAGRSAQWQGFSPTWIPGLALWLRADLGVTAVAGPVTATGTTPPTVTLAGTPTATQTAAATPYVELDCTTLGILGTSKYTLKLNGATVATNVASASSGVSIPGSGLTAGWAAGASAVNDVYTANVVASAWSDQSASANNAAQATGTKRPIYIAHDSAYHSAATMTFASASSQGFTSVAVFPHQPFTVFIVGESTSGAAQQQLFGDSGANVTTYIATNWSVFAGGGFSSSNTTQGTGLAFATTFNTTTSALYISSSTVAAASGSAGASNPSGNEGIGCQGGTANFLNGKLSDLAVATGVPDVSWRVRMFAYDGNLYATASK